MLLTETTSLVETQGATARGVTAPDGLILPFPCALSDANPGNDTMLLTDSIRRMYSLDILDPRFISSAPSPSDPSVKPRTSSSRTPLADIKYHDGHSREGVQSLPNGAKPSRWGTPEYWLYYVLFFGALGWMFKVAVDVSRGKARFPHFLLTRTSP